MGKTPKEFHYNYFEIRDGRLYYKNMNMLLMTEDGMVRSAGKIAHMSKKNRLRMLGFDIHGGKVMAQQAAMLNRVEEGLPSMPDIAKADDIELQEIIENAARSTENLIVQLEGEH